jgi:hypothetical protein
MKTQKLSTLVGTLVPLADFQAANAVIFPSETSLRWFLRVNRRELVELDAVTQIAGRLLIHPENFAKAATAIGRRQLERQI